MPLGAEQQDDPRRPPARGERRDRSSWTEAGRQAEEAAARAVLTPPDGDPAWPADRDGWRHDHTDPVWAFPVPFTVVDGLLLLALGLAVQVVVGGVVFALSGGDLDDVGSLAAVGLIYVATLAAAWLLLRLRGAWSWRLAGPVRPRPGHVLTGLGAGVAAWLGLNALLLVFAALTGYEPETRQSVLEQAETGGAVAVVLGVLVAVLLAPLVEEVVHRGVIFQGLRRRVGARAAGLVSAVVFAVVHLELAGEPPLLAALFGFGLVLAWVMHRTGSLLAAVAAHATFNGLTLLLSIATAGT